MIRHLNHKQINLPEVNNLNIEMKLQNSWKVGNI